jgi:WD40 repeat protein
MDMNSDIQKEWNEKGAAFGIAINEMVAFGETHGWNKWTGGEPVDEREHLADEVLRLLKEANTSGKVTEFREAFPPSYSPFNNYIKINEQNIELLHFIGDEKVVFFVRCYDQKPQGYILDGDKLMELDPSVKAIGKSKQGNVFAVFTDDGRLTTIQGWDGEVIATFTLEALKKSTMTQLLPFNDGKKVLLVSPQGIYLLSEGEEKLIHPEPEEAEEPDEYDDYDDEEEEDDDFEISMENADLSNDNRYIVVADQDSSHRILNAVGEPVVEIKPESSYPHFCLFSSNDDQVIMNSCHFYNGVTIAVNASKLDDLTNDTNEKSYECLDIDESMRVYSGVAADGYYILGDADGYLKAFDKRGNQLWRHYLGSSITSMSLSDDEKTLWVGSYSGMLHKLKFGAGHRDTHTIGNGNHYEELRIIFWKDQPVLHW